MYEHVRAVVWGLILSLVFTVAAGIVAFIDPFENGVAWANWLTMSVTAILAVALSTIIVATVDDEGDFWSWTAGAVVSWLMSAGFIIGVMVTGYGGIRSEYHALAWTVFAIPLAVLPVSALVQYLVAAAVHVRNSGQVRRIA